MALKVTFLGSGDAFASGGRRQTCIYVDAGSTRFLIDCGPSVLVGTKQLGISTNDISSILLTHLHGDHFGGIPFFFLDAVFIADRSAPLIIAGPPGLEETIRTAHEILFPGTAKLERGFETTYVELHTGAEAAIGEVRVRPYPVVHQEEPPSYALRIEAAGRIITYSGDTEWTNALIEAAAGADLFICESNDFATERSKHLSYKTILSHREELECKRIVLTHVGDEVLEREGEIEFDIANDGAVFEV